MADKYPNTTKVAKDQVADWIDQMLKNIDRGGRYGNANNSGDLSQSLGKNLRQKVKITPKGLLSLKIEYLRYGDALDEGRRPGKFPPYKDPRNGILFWVKTKLSRRSDMTDEQLAFLIARKIAKKGTKGIGWSRS